MTSSSSADEEEQQQRQQASPSPSSSPSLSITDDWESIIGKNVKTIDYQDAGKVLMNLENEDAIIISSEGPHSSYNYKVPKNCIQGFEGPDLMLSITRNELADHEIDDIKDYAAQLRSIKTEQKGEGKEIIVPVVEEKLNVSKKVITDEVTIIKEPVTETKIIEVSVMHESIVLEKRPTTAVTEEGEDDSNTSTFEKPPPLNT
ncbi:MAG: DUF2382 domain-containing protein, partial [Thermoproteota archaeon]|nr:DUF2382 domain-containing protein [Thermoproteota archaeon]